MVHRVTKNQIQLKQHSTYHTHVISSWNQEFFSENSVTSQPIPFKWQVPRNCIKFQQQMVTSCHTPLQRLQSVRWTLQTFLIIQFSSVQSLSSVQLFATPPITARQASLSITNSQSPPKPMSIKSVMPSSYLILCPQSLPASESFPMSQLFS